MAKINSKVHSKLLTDLESLADGAKKHAGNPKIAASVDETNIRTLKGDLETLRETYTQTETATRMAYDAYAAKQKEAKELVSNSKRVVKGVLTTKAENLKDFGIEPEKKKTTKKAAAKAANKG
jgi:hypothetical protein